MSLLLSDQIQNAVESATQLDFSNSFTHEKDLEWDVDPIDVYRTNREIVFGDSTTRPEPIVDLDSLAGRFGVDSSLIKDRNTIALTKDEAETFREIVASVKMTEREGVSCLEQEMAVAGFGLPAIVAVVVFVVVI